MKARITGRSYLGARTLYQLDIGGRPLRVESDKSIEGPDAWVEIPESSCVLFPKEGSELP